MLLSTTSSSRIPSMLMIGSGSPSQTSGLRTIVDQAASVESKLPAAVQVDLSSQLQRKLRQTPPDEPKTAAQADPLSTGHRRRVPRRPSVGKMIAQAEKATGKPITSVTLPDGTKLDFGKPASEPDNPWFADLPKETKQ